MATTPAFPTTPAPSFAGPSSDLVHLRVKVERDRCNTTDIVISQRLDELEEKGLTLSIEQLVASTNLYFASTVVDHGEGEEKARIRLAWANLEGWNMRSVTHIKNPKRKVLVVDAQPNSSMTAFRTELLALGVSLEIGIRIYGTAYSFWSLTDGNEFFDLSATTAEDNEIRIEARGRINRTNVGVARRQVYKKFKNPDFSQAAGVIFFPRTDNKGREDVLVIDPDGDPVPRLSNTRYRNLLQHYVPILFAQGGPVRAFGERLRDLALADDAFFSRYLAGEGAPLIDGRSRRGHSGFDWQQRHYVGTFFEDIAWPRWLTGFERPTNGGVFFWGIEEEIVKGFETGALAALEFIAGAQAAVERGERTMSIVMPDRTLLIWGYTIQDLYNVESSSLKKALEADAGLHRDNSAKRTPDE